MAYTLRYRSSRSDVWHWYWRLWRSRLWRVHAVPAVAVALIVMRSGNPVRTGAIALSVFVGLVVVSAAVPQILFKSSEQGLQNKKGFRAYDNSHHPLNLAVAVEVTILFGAGLVSGCFAVLQGAFDPNRPAMSVGLSRQI